MPAYPLRALVLRKTKLGESDLILTLLASDGRQVRAVAKGARGGRSRFGARVEPYSVADLLVHTGRNLEVIAEAQTVASHAGLREDLDRSQAAAVAADVLDKISVEGQVEPTLFEMACVTLGVMESADTAALPVLVEAFLLKALAMHGYRPSIDECASCGCDDVSAARFSAATGGSLCERCFGEDPSAAAISDGARTLLRVLLASTMADIAGRDVPPSLTAEVMRLLAGYTSHHLPARLKALEMYVAAHTAR